MLLVFISFFFFFFNLTHSPSCLHPSLCNSISLRFFFFFIKSDQSGWREFKKKLKLWENERNGTEHFKENWRMIHSGEHHIVKTATQEKCWKLIIKLWFVPLVWCSHPYKTGFFFHDDSTQKHFAYSQEKNVRVIFIQCSAKKITHNQFIFFFATKYTYRPNSCSVYCVYQPVCRSADCRFVLWVKRMWIYHNYGYGTWFVLSFFFILLLQTVRSFITHSTCCSCQFSSRCWIFSIQDGKNARILIGGTWKLFKNSKPRLRIVNAISFNSKDEEKKKFCNLQWNASQCNPCWTIQSHPASSIHYPLLYFILIKMIKVFNPLNRYSRLKLLTSYNSSLLLSFIV